MTASPFVEDEAVRFVVVIYFLNQDRVSGTSDLLPVYLLVFHPPHRCLTLYCGQAEVQPTAEK